jgi:hypothetical protein
MAEQRRGVPNSSWGPSDVKTWFDYVPMVGAVVSALMTIAGFAVQKPVLSETIFFCLIALGIVSISGGGFLLVISRSLRDLRERRTLRGWIFVISGLFALGLAVVPYQASSL